MPSLPECNRWVVGEGRNGVRSDFVWLAYRVVGEADGRVKYTDPRDPAEALVKEKARQLRIEELGFVVVRWTGAEVLHRPDVVIARIARQTVARGTPGRRSSARLARFCGASSVPRRKQLGRFGLSLPLRVCAVGRTDDDPGQVGDQ